MVDAFFESHVAIGLAIDALFIGGFYLFGLKAQQGRTWAFVAGVLLYLGDALLWLKFAAWMPLAFHALALFYIGRAWVNLQAARKATGMALSRQRWRQTSRRRATTAMSCRHLPSPRPVKPPVG